MAGLKNSTFGKRLRASHHDPDDDSPRRTRPRINPIFGISASPASPLDTSASSSTPPAPIPTAAPTTSFSSSQSTLVQAPSQPNFAPAHKTHNNASRNLSPTRKPRQNARKRDWDDISDAFGSRPAPSPSSTDRAKSRDYGDRFVPSRDAGDMRTSYHLMEDSMPSTPSKNRIIPTETDALKEQANAIFSSILHTEVTPPRPSCPSSPQRPSATHTPASAMPTTPTRRRIFQYHSPGSGPMSGIISTNSSSHPPGTPPQRRGLDAPTDAAYSLSPVRAASRTLLESPRRAPRALCKTPYRVLDAPELADDFYLNLVDWSSTNVLGVGLGRCVYLWTAHNAAVSKLCDLSADGDTVSSVSWVQKGSTLAVGTVSGRLHIYDAHTLTRARSYLPAHQQRIGALAWSSHVLSSGSRDRAVHHRDVRVPDTRPFRRSAGHRQEVCGLKWSDDGGPQGAALASGGNDNKVCIWDLRGSKRASGLGGGGGFGGGSGPGRGGTGGGGAVNTGLGGGVGSNGSFSSGASTATLGSSLTMSSGGRGIIGGSGPTSASATIVSGGTNTATIVDSEESDAPLWKFHEHTAAVKALAWDPHVSGLLATGGGTQDKHIRFWNTLSGTMISELDTGSQVCNLMWSRTSHELVSTHGFSSTTAQNQICIWRYPALKTVGALSGHAARVLYLAMSPDGETIVTGAGDETLRFWNAFPRSGGGERRESALDYGRLIR